MKHLTEYHVKSQGEFITIETNSLLLVMKLTSYLDTFKGEQVDDKYLVMYHSSSQSLFEALIKELESEIDEVTDELGDVLVGYKPRNIFQYAKDVIKENVSSLLKLDKGKLEDDEEDKEEEDEEVVHKPLTVRGLEPLTVPVQEPLTLPVEETLTESSPEPVTPSITELPSDKQLVPKQIQQHKGDIHMKNVTRGVICRKTETGIELCMFNPEGAGQPIVTLKYTIGSFGLKISEPKIVQVYAEDDTLKHFPKDVLKNVYSPITELNGAIIEEWKGSQVELYGDVRAYRNLPESEKVELGWIDYDYSLDFHQEGNEIKSIIPEASVSLAYHAVMIQNMLFNLEVKRKIDEEVTPDYMGKPEMTGMNMGGAKYTGPHFDMLPESERKPYTPEPEQAHDIANAEVHFQMVLEEEKKVREAMAPPTKPYPREFGMVDPMPSIRTLNKPESIPAPKREEIEDDFPTI